MTESKIDQFLEKVQTQGAETVRNLVREGNRRHVVVRRDQSIVLDMPVNIAVASALLAPRVVALGTLGALVAHCSMEIVNTPDLEPVLDVREPG